MGVISQSKKEGTHDSEVTGRWSDSEGADKPGYTPPEEESDRKSVATERAAAAKERIPKE